MPNIPRRLIVIEAAIPEGACCTGCYFCSAVTEALDTDPPEGQYQVIGYVCCMPGEGCNGEEPELDIDTAQPLRLPACRARDGWTAYPPGSGVPELVEAAKEMVVAMNMCEVAESAGTLEHKQSAAERWNRADERYYAAASKVAEVGKL